MISDIINEVKKHFEELSVVRDNRHTLLGVNIEIKDKTIQDNLVEQLEECIEMFGEDISTLVTSLATNNFSK